MGKVDAAGAYRLSLAAKLIEAGVTPRELAIELGLRLVQFDVSKYNENQPRVLAGSGRESGQWTSGDAAAGDNDSTLIEGRSAATDSDNFHRVPELPKDAITVRRPDGSTIYDPASTKKRLMAPTRANFPEVYAAGEKIANWQIMEQIVEGKTALQQFGTYDFQRDKATNTHFKSYVHAANYAVDVYTAGAGYGKWLSITIAQTWGFFTSSKKYDDTARVWAEKGRDDAHRGDWQ